MIPKTNSRILPGHAFRFEDRRKNRIGLTPEPYAPELGNAPRYRSPLEIPLISSFVYRDLPNGVDALVTVWRPAISLVEAVAAYIAVEQPQASPLKAPILQAQTSSGYKRCTNSTTPILRVYIKSRQLASILKIGVTRGTGSREPDNSAILYPQRLCEA